MAHILFGSIFSLSQNLLDFDYGESDDEDDRKDGHGHGGAHQNSLPATG